MHATVFTIATEYRGSRITITAERMPHDELWAIQVRIDGELLAHICDDGDLWGRIVPGLLDDAIADIDAREDDGQTLDEAGTNPQVS